MQRKMYKFYVRHILLTDTEEVRIENIPPPPGMYVLVYSNSRSQSGKRYSYRHLCIPRSHRGVEPLELGLFGPFCKNQPEFYLGSVSLGVFFGRLTYKPKTKC